MAIDLPAELIIKRPVMVATVGDGEDDPADDDLEEELDDEENDLGFGDEEESLDEETEQ